ncbi:ABC transporter ATP-binding protein, partial [Dysosmobacter sp.]|uniref:ABC transporter ATP-binding protein n=1 Tax=Dysosmobacter sp. TaxID=2591382 RepID=UPI002D80A66B
AIVREPKILLMDEPLSNLDAKLRNQMRAEIIKLRQKIDPTFLYVTHDQTEAMTLGDRIVIMKDGFIQQIGTPQEVFDHPANLFVAGFIGMPQMNFFDAELKKDGEKYLVSVGGYQVQLSEAKCANLAKKGVGSQSITLGVRPNHIVLDQQGDSVPAKMDVFEMMGNEIHLHVTAEGRDVVIIVPTMDLNGSYTETFAPGRDLAFTFRGSACHVFDKDGKNLEF